MKTFGVSAFIGMAILGGSAAQAHAMSSLSSVPSSSDALGSSSNSAAPVAGQDRSDDRPLGDSGRLEDYVDAINDQRGKDGDISVEQNSKLDQSAQEWADNLAASGKLEHSEMKCIEQDGVYTDADGNDVDYEQLCLSENIAAVEAGTSPEEIVDKWADSPEHNENMLADNAIAVGHGEAEYEDGDKEGMVASVSQIVTAHDTDGE